MSTKSILLFGGFLILAGIWTTIHHYFGKIEGLRFWGLGLFVVSIVFIFIKKIPVGVQGEEPSFYLVGWKKAIIIFPAIFISLSVIFYPEGVACYINLNGYKCT